MRRMSSPWLRVLGAMLFGVGVLVAAGGLIAPERHAVEPGLPAPAPEVSRDGLDPRAVRVMYKGGGSQEWGTLCRLSRDPDDERYASVHHVTANGVPAVGPALGATASSAPSDWSFLGVAPEVLDPAAFPALQKGMKVEIHGFPARDRDGEVIPGVVYIDDTVPPFWWVELRDAVGDLPAEGVVGGISGSCVFDDGGDLVAVVHANGFSPIENTTNTWAMVVPLREAVREARGEVTFSGTASSLLPRTHPVPSLDRGRFALRPSER